MIRPIGGPALVTIIPIDQLPTNRRTYSGKSPVREENNSVVSEKSFHYKRASMMESSVTKKRLQQKRSTRNIGLGSGTEEPVYKIARRESEVLINNDRTFQYIDDDSPLKV
jgi:hypothetical protein